MRGDANDDLRSFISQVRASDALSFKRFHRGESDQEVER